MRRILVAAEPDAVEPYLGFGAYIVRQVRYEGTTPVNVPDAHVQWFRDRLRSGQISSEDNGEQVPIRFDGAQARNMLVEFICRHDSDSVKSATWIATDVLEVWLSNGEGVIVGRIGEPR